MPLPGCGAGQVSPVPQLTVLQCPPVVPCTLTAIAPKTNGDLNLALDQAEADWAMCAAQVDMTYQCQKKAKANVKAR
ncbi:Rz1-like lysis system protein LysC [Photobacterium phosphoreum]|uniref:Rz1-like lysis system protein LysC n=1 Tax=Photobacterium phosphoreum TaxID=659 RepID=UPI0034D35B0B|nr:hypothetical protein [Photobacterium phosphoreum]